MLKEIKNKIMRLYEANFIRSCRYAEWVSNIIHVYKKIESYEVCIDFRDFNKASSLDSYLMLIVDLLVDAISGHKVISFMDDNEGYNQIFMAKEDIAKTAFSCTEAIGLYELILMNFGRNNAGATYQRDMNYIFHKLIDMIIEIYIDDVVIKSKGYKEHLADLRDYGMPKKTWMEDES